MTENQRFSDVIFYLKKNKIVRNQQQFVEEIKSDKATVSLIKNGKQKISADMYRSILTKYPFISELWFIKGEGEMIKEANQTNNVDKNSGIVGIQGNGNNITNYETSEILGEYTSRLKERDEQVSLLIKQTGELIGQNSKLIEQIDKLIDKLK